MAKLSAAIGLMLVVSFLSTLVDFGEAQPHAHKHRDLHLFDTDGQTTPTPRAPLSIDYSSVVMPCTTGTNCVAPPDPPECPGVDGWPYTSTPEVANYTIICNTDFPGQNIYPFHMSATFEDCLLECDVHNENGAQPPCVGFVFAPDRVADDNDCYLKYSLENQTSATIPLIGATMAHQPIPQSSSFIQASGTEDGEGQSQTSNHEPKVSDYTLLGASSNNPTKQYVQHPMALPVKLDNDLLVPGINLDLITDYPIAGDSGVWTSSSTLLSHRLGALSDVPHLSRDGGKGGEINGTHVFIFCDTAVFQNGNMVGFVSSSVATDAGFSGQAGKPLSLVDHIGEWQDDAGRMRGLAPMTTAEEAFNVAMSGNGYRYAVWPESSLIPLNQTHSLLYASLVYDRVDMETQAAYFTQIGNTLLVVSIDATYGPAATRTVNQMFTENEVAWGSLGGFRSWGSSGIGGTDGHVYLFGSIEEGVLLARTTPDGIADRTSFTYWDGTDWSSGMSPNDSVAYFFDEAVQDLDIVYSPHHGTFIAVFLNHNADNTFYYRFLKTDATILPPYAGGNGDEDFAEALVQNQWSEKQVLYTAPQPPEAYIYAGGVHAGYFGEADITNGGTKMLLSWTQHTGQDAASAQSGYAHMTAVITFEH